jgi:hypothetical protein
MKKLLLAISLVSIGGIFSMSHEAASAAVQEDTVVTFKDPVFEKVVRYYANKPHGPLYTQDVASIKKINTSDLFYYLGGETAIHLDPMEIKDLSGIEQLVNLESLYIDHYHRVSSLSPLGELKNLTSLTIEHFRDSPIKNIAVLKELTQLEELSLSGLTVNDMSALQSLTNLKSLSISNSNLSEANILADFHHLEELYLYDTHIKDFSFLRTLTGLKKLKISLGWNQKLELNTKLIEDHTQLQSLSLNGTSISDLRFLKNMYLMEELDLAGNQIWNTKELEQLSNLRELHLNHNPLRGKESHEVLMTLKNRGVDVYFNEFYSGTTEIILTVNDAKNVRVNGQLQPLDAAPYIKNGRTFVPLRFITEHLSTRISWNQSLQEVTIYTDSRQTIKMRNGSQTLHVNGQALLMDAAPEIKNGRTFVPVRFVSEQLGAEVKYNAATKQVTIVK